jgi:predicted nucleotidyltransferase
MRALVVKGAAMLNQHIDIPLDQIEILAQKYPIRRLSLFGSVLRDDFRPDSDIDVLVEFEPDAHATLFDMGEIQMDLSDLLGREVDLKTPGFLSPMFRSRVLAEAVMLYEHDY